MALKEQDIVLTTKDAAGNTVIQMPITRAKNVEDLIDLVYPVGAIYMSTVGTSPATLFGGTWVALDEGRVLIGANSTYKAGATGGEATHTLTTAEMPSHSHTGSTGNGTTTDHIHGIGNNNGNNWGTRPATAATGTTVSTTLDSQASYKRAWNGSGGENALTSVGTGSGAFKANELTSKSVAASSGSANSHSHTVSIGNTGSGNAHNNMQPYLAVYMWKRTA